jgi:hypothetical protein
MAIFFGFAFCYNIGNLSQSKKDFYVSKDKTPGQENY